jgi:hypothetical protein
MMGIDFAVPWGMLAAVAGIGALFSAILPTCLYMYVEPRGRQRWAVAGDTAATRRAPVLVRFTAWLSFLVGQLAVPWLLVPAACAGLAYAQVRLGVDRPVGLAVTVALGVASLAQSLLSLGLVPYGVRLLAHDPRVCAASSGRARRGVLLALAMLGGCFAVRYLTMIPSFVHPVLRETLRWTALYPVMAYAALCLVHSVFLDRCAQAICQKK